MILSKSRVSLLRNLNVVSRHGKHRYFSSIGDDSLEAQNLINELGRRQITSISLEDLVKTGRGEYLHMWDHADNERCATKRILMQSASFLRRELPVRLAHRIQDLSTVPWLNEMQSVKQVKDLYVSSLLKLERLPILVNNPEREAAFASTVQSIYDRHSGVLVQMARGAFELRKAVRSGSVKGTKTLEFEQMEDSHAFLDRFYMSRIGIRVLIGQYLSLRQSPIDNYVGVICSNTSPCELVKRAIDEASFMCDRKYGDSPVVNLNGRLDLTFPYIPSHIHYIMLELIKNSMRATVDWHGIDANYPPINVVIADGKENEDVVIKISDEGGGIPRSYMRKIWSYLFTTADPAIQEGVVAFNESVDHSIDSPLAGLGYGLPISRSYARYFGGDLSIMSMEGYGTDAFVYLNRLKPQPASNLFFKELE